MGARVFGALAVHTFWGLPDVCQGWRIWLSIVHSTHCLICSWVGYGILKFLLLSSLQTPDMGCSQIIIYSIDATLREVQNLIPIYFFIVSILS